MIKINVISEMFFEDIEKCKHEFPECEFILGDENYENSQILWGNPYVGALSNCTDLKWVQTLSAGVDAYIKDKDNFPKGVKLTSATGAYSLAISEYMLATHLSLYKNLHLYRDNQNQSLWKHAGKSHCVKGSTVLILGMGDIGSAYAKLVKSMGAYVIGVRRTDMTKQDYVDEVHGSDMIDELLPRADMVVIAMPGTEKTRKLINADKFAKMKDGAMLMNIGRGIIVDTDDLCEAIENGKLSGVALDVVDPEPLPSDHKLWKYKNVIITPHMSGEFGHEATKNGNLEQFKINLRRFIDGKPLLNEIDFEIGYRKAETKSYK